MPGDPDECRERSKRCWALATQTKNPVLQKSLVGLAEQWALLAVELAATRRLLDVLDGEASDKKTG